jgi:hypothetical protein
VQVLNHELKGSNRVDLNSFFFKESTQPHFDPKNILKKVYEILTRVLSWIDRVEGRPRFLIRLD